MSERVGGGGPNGGRVQVGRGTCGEGYKWGGVRVERGEGHRWVEGPREGMLHMVIVYICLPVTGVEFS